MTKYNVRPLVAQEIEISTGTIISATWCRYFISITLHQCYIEATWKTRPRSNLDGHKETFNSLQEYLDWFANLKKTYGRRISQYTATLNALEKWESDKRETQLFDSLAASELMKQLNK